MENISVIIPMYNASRTIERCLNSVAGQTYKGIYEIIVINDGSKDDSLLIVEAFIKKHKSSNIKIIDKENGGVSSARNAGMKISQGNFIAFLDSDDEWLPKKLSKQFEVFENDPDVALVGTTINDMPFKRFFLKKISEVTEITLKNLLFKNFFQPSTVLLKRELLNTVGFFNEKQRYAEDGNYFMRIAFKHKCVLLNDSLLNFGDGKRGFGSSGLSANIKEMEKGELKNLIYAHRNLNVNFLLFGIAVVFSVLKYIRRIIIVQIEKKFFPK